MCKFNKSYRDKELIALFYAMSPSYDFLLAEDISNSFINLPDKGSESQTGL